ncbi:hypothetical protein LPICM17_130022 [Lactococcus piscium]|nr:hypothetical protein LPICM17_130022 [Lactococcus piscium]
MFSYWTKIWTQNIKDIKDNMGDSISRHYWDRDTINLETSYY